MGSQITEGLGQAWAMIATFVPKLLGFLLVLVIGWFIAKALAKGVQFLLKRVGFEKLVDKSGLNGAMRQSSMDASGLIAKIVYYFVLLIALQLAFGVFGASNPVSTLLNEVIAYLPRIVVAMVLVIVASAIGTALKGLVTGALGQRSYTKILGNITYGFVMALGVIAALNQLGIAVSVTMPVLIAVLATVAACDRHRCGWRPGPPDAAALGGLADPRAGRGAGPVADAACVAGDAVHRGRPHG